MSSAVIYKNNIGTIMGWIAKQNIFEYNWHTCTSDSVSTKSNILESASEIKFVGFSRI